MGAVPSLKGIETVAVEDAQSIDAALGASDASALIAALGQQQIGAVLIGHMTHKVPSESIASALIKRSSIPGLRGLYLSPEMAAYGPAEPVRFDPTVSAALAHVARSILGGAKPPRVESFPPDARAAHNVEVMVMLRADKTPRLWRSARAGSVAQGLVTAASVARQRWAERASVMGGDIDRALLALSVEVSLLVDDGTIARPTEAFVNRVVSDDQGVGFEDKGEWRYSLPEPNEQAMKPYAALLDLLRMNGKNEDYLREDGVRVYRFNVERVAVSPAVVAAASTGGVDSRVASPLAAGK